MRACIEIPEGCGMSAHGLLFSPMLAFTAHTHTARAAEAMSHVWGRNGVWDHVTSSGSGGREAYDCGCCCGYTLRNRVDLRVDCGHARKRRNHNFRAFALASWKVVSLWLGMGRLGSGSQANNLHLRSGGFGCSHRPLLTEGTVVVGVDDCLPSQKRT